METMENRSPNSLSSPVLASGSINEARQKPSALILLSGLLCDRALWQPIIPYLQKDIKILIPDLTRANRIETMADQVLNEAPESFALVGLSMGGYVAMAILRKAAARVTHLALLNTSARADTDDQRKRRQLLISMARAGEFKGVTPRLLPLLIHPDRINDSAVTEVIYQMAERVGRDAFFNQQEAIMNRSDSRASLGAIAAPALVIGGDKDAITPPEVTKEIASLIPGATYHLLKDCGHLSSLEQPTGVATALKDLLSRGSEAQ